MLPQILRELGRADHAGRCRAALAAGMSAQAFERLWQRAGTRIRLPSALKAALATAGPIGGTPGSPIPRRRRLAEARIWTSTFGIASILSGVYNRIALIDLAFRERDFLAQDGAQPEADPALDLSADLIRIDRQAAIDGRNDALDLMPSPSNGNFGNLSHHERSSGDRDPAEAAVGRGFCHSAFFRRQLRTVAWREPGSSIDRRNSSGSCPAASATSSRKASAANAVCVEPTERPQRTGTRTSVVVSPTGLVLDGNRQIVCSFDGCRVDPVLDHPVPGRFRHDRLTDNVIAPGNEFPRCVDAGLQAVHIGRPIPPGGVSSSRVHCTLTGARKPRAFATWTASATTSPSNTARRRSCRRLHDVEPDLFDGTPAISLAEFLVDVRGADAPPHISIVPSSFLRATAFQGFQGGMREIGEFEVASMTLCAAVRMQRRHPVLAPRMRRCLAGKVAIGGDELGRPRFSASVSSHSTVTASRPLIAAPHMLATTPRRAAFPPPSTTPLMRGRPYVEGLDLGAEEGRVDHHRRQHSRELHVDRVLLGSFAFRALSKRFSLVADELPVRPVP